MAGSSAPRGEAVAGHISHRHCEVLPPGLFEKTRTRLIESTLELFPYPALLLDRSLLVTALNSRARRILPPEGLALPVPAEAFFPQQALERIGRAFSAPSITSTAYFGTEIAAKQGRVETRVKAHRLTDLSGRTLGVALFLCGSVSEAASEEVCHAKRIEALGLYAAGVIHEFNNLLAVIAGRASIGFLAEGPAAKDRALRNVLKAAQRAEHVVKDLLVYVEKREPEFVKADLRAAVLEAISLQAMELANGYVELTHSLDEMPPVTCDPVQISQICFNLIRNAREAMPEGGRLTVTLKRQGNWAVITVSDTGVGIPAELRSQIFEPFVSYGKSCASKSSGTGLGLFVAREIVMAHGGDISVESIIAKGSKFIVRLPFLPDHPAARAASLDRGV
ncbi:MAG: two-component system sensor histidine kinase NtrB [Planctomycetota bacterium]|jgi:signal transduction histidine kinase